jgi:hypothetical protein
MLSTIPPNEILFAVGAVLSIALGFVAGLLS